MSETTFVRIEEPFRHEHDWRADPEGYVLLSNPPSQRIVCAICDAKSSRTAPPIPSISRDPKDWPSI